jgi:hypothetical protein
MRTEKSTFEPGKTYFTRSVCDHECIVSLTVASRTAKTIKTLDGKTLQIKLWQGVEQVRPWGSYSMAPIVGADRMQ